MGLRLPRGDGAAVLGEELGVSRQAINVIETGRFDPSLPLALRIGRLFGRHVEDIFHLTGG